MPELRIKIPEELEYRLEHERPSYLDRKAFVCLLLASALDRGLTIPAYCVGAGNQVGHPQAQQEPPNAADAQGASAACQVLDSSKESSSPSVGAGGDGVGRGSGGTPRNWGGKPRFLFSVPPDLDWCKADLMEFWLDYKAGRKTQAAANLLIKGVRDIAERYGQKVAMAQLELAKANCWESITLANYERFGLPRSKPNTYAPPEPSKHPAGRLFMNGRWVDEEPPVTNPLLKGAF